MVEARKIWLGAAMVLGASLTSCLNNGSEAAKDAGATPPTAIAATETASTPIKAEVALIHTSKGKIKVKLFPSKAPKTVANFVGLATGKKDWTHPKTGEKKAGTPLYNDTIFHRVIPKFMIQAGDPLGTGTGGPGYRFEDEISASDSFAKPGMLAMANSGPNTNGSQFFITVAATPWLNGKHTIFGEVVEGQDIVQKIATAPRDRRDRPNTTIKIEKIEIQ